MTANVKANHMIV